MNEEERELFNDKYAELTSRGVPSEKAIRDAHNYAKDNSSNKGAIANSKGKNFERSLAEKLGGKYPGKVSAPGMAKEFDVSYTNAKGKETLVEAKSGWSRINFDTFKSDMGRAKKVADYHNKAFEVHSKGKIPDQVKEWLDRKEIDYIEHNDENPDEN